ncbi:MAG: FG-GAP-like repeat-containing protein [Phycisphaerales bacterium]
MRPMPMQTPVRSPRTCRAARLCSAAGRVAAAVAAVVAVAALMPPSCGGSEGQSDGGAKDGKKDATRGRAGAPAAPVLDPALTEAVNRGVGLMGKFEFAQAAELFGALAAAHPAVPLLRLNHAIATLNQSRDGAQDEAAAALRTLIQSSPPAEIAVRARYCLALCELYLGRAAEAVPHFVAVAESRGADAYAQYFAGQALEQVGETSKALGWYERSAERDPMLKSALLGVQRCARKLGDDARAERALAAFEQLSENPRARNAEFKYTRMGDAGLAQAEDDTARLAYTPPSGPIFESPAPIAFELEAGAGDAGVAAIDWSSEVGQHACTVDLNGDGLLDLVIARAFTLKTPDGMLGPRTLVLEARAGGGFTARPSHPLMALTGVRVSSLLFGDVDGNGRVDAYVCATGGNRLLLQDDAGAWRDATAEWSAAGNGGVCNDGALADLDHDGDLDVLLLYREGPNDLLANVGVAGGASGFRSIGAQAGLQGAIGNEDRAPISCIVSDFDYDRDADILILNDALPHQLFLNERLWKWTEGQAPGVSAAQLQDAAVAAAVVEIADLPLRRAVFATSGYLRLPTRVENMPITAGVGLGVADVTGDGHQDILVLGNDRIAMRDEAGRLVQEFPVPEGALRTQVAMLDPARGAHLITLRAGQPPLLWAPGAGRGPFAALAFSGRTDPAQSMRSNASGIGTSWAARVGQEWFGGESFRGHTGRGQSLAPVAVGTGPFAKLDLVEIEWSDGVFQSEIDLAAGALHAITETQRQISSCPVLFAWNGTELRFVSDLLGVGGLGYLLEPGVYSEPRPWESFVLPAGALAPKPDGTLSITLAEPMEESCMLDSARLRAVDLPEGWDIAPDERMAIGGAAPTGDLVAWRRAWMPVDRGGQPRADLAAADLSAADPGPVDPRFIGRLAGEQVIELEFGTAIDAIDDPWLVIDGWIEYPYCQTMFAAWQAGAKFRAPGLEARAADGRWVELVGEWGYPAGMPRRMALPVPRAGLPAGATALRMRTNMEIYFDSVRLVAREPLPAAPVECALRRGALASPGFARRTTGPQRQPFYDRADMRPLWDCRFQRGLYTEFGDVRALLGRADAAPVVFGPGEEIALDFASPATPPAPGTVRRYLLEVRGWCKDMDLFTRDGETIEPLPGPPADAGAAELLRASRTRPAGGR